MTTPSTLVPAEKIPTAKSREFHKKMLELVGRGVPVGEAARTIGRTSKNYDWHRKHYPAFAAAIDATRQARREGRALSEVPPFDVFCRRFLHHDVFPHMLQWIDLLEGREPRDLHPSMIYEPGSKRLMVFNTPPEHAKSTIITTDYVTHRIVQDPNIRVLIISKTQVMAKKFLYAIKSRLTHPNYRELWAAFSRSGGFKDASDSWTADMIYLASAERDGEAKDPTVQALGIGGHIYGSRADLIILDDCVVLSNAHEFDKQIDWIQGEVLTRLTKGGRLLIVGTRMASRDLYSEIRDPARYTNGKSPWTYFAQPAVLDFAEEPKDWTTLWPYADMPTGVDDEPQPDGTYVKWDGPSLDQRRGEVKPQTWAMVYQQQQVSEYAVFTAEAVRGCINIQRRWGLMAPGAPGSRREGMAGLYVIGSCDPAAEGDSGFIIYAVDRQTRKRYVLEAYAAPHMAHGGAMKRTIRDFTDKYGVSEWRIEKNAFQGFLVYDEDLRAFMADKGCRIYPHFTGAQKLDAEMGVASMAALFDGWEEGRALIELPSTSHTESGKMLVEQLLTWQPNQSKKLKSDLVMALWFAEIRAREITASSSSNYHVKSDFTSARDREAQVVISIDDYLAEQARGRVA